MSTQYSGHVGKRQQLLRRGGPTLPPDLRINSKESLKSHLRLAIKVEHTTIPVYLCALYSIKDGHNVEAAEIIKSVVLEEMLHMILAANVLNAIDGSPSIDDPEYIPQYPKVPFFHFKVHLRPFSRSAIRTFCKIERPEPPGDRISAAGPTIAQYYEAIELALLEFSGINVQRDDLHGVIEKIVQGSYKLSPSKNIFKGDESRQITPEHYYGGGGEAIRVTDLGSALRALYEISGQGEGLHHTIWDGDQEEFDQVKELAHFFRFNEILKQRRYTANDTPEWGPTGAKMIVQWDQVYPMQIDPKMSRYPKGSELWRKSYEFNRTYMGLLHELNAALNGEPKRMMQSVARMYDLKYQAVELMKIPVGNGETAGPSFEYVE